MSEDKREPDCKAVIYKEAGALVVELFNSKGESKTESHPAMNIIEFTVKLDSGDVWFRTTPETVMVGRDTP